MKLFVLTLWDALCTAFSSGLGWIPFLFGCVLPMTPNWTLKSTGLLLAVFVPMAALLWGSAFLFSSGNEGTAILAILAIVALCFVLGAVVGTAIRWAGKKLGIE